MPTIENAEELLKEMRGDTGADCKFMNPFGDYVWLMRDPVVSCGTTDCCLVSEPCDYHAQLTHSAPASQQ